MLDHLLNTPWAFGLIVVSGVGGMFGSAICFQLIRFVTGAPAGDFREYIYSGFLTGVIERLFFTLATGWLGYNGIIQGVIAWVAIKGQVHYKMFSEQSNKDLGRVYTGLLGSLASLLFAIAGGYIWNENVTWQCLWGH